MMLVQGMDIIPDADWFNRSKITTVTETRDNKLLEGGRGGAVPRFPYVQYVTWWDNITHKSLQLLRPRCMQLRYRSLLIDCLFTPVFDTSKRGVFGFCGIPLQWPLSNYAMLSRISMPWLSYLFPIRLVCFPLYMQVLGLENVDYCGITWWLSMKGKTGAKVIKLDLEKAYDKLEWNFIQQVLFFSCFLKKGSI